MSDRPPLRMAAPLALALLGAPLAVGAPTPVDPDGYFSVTTPREWSFPRDFGRHDGFRVEWWYFTGNVTATTGEELGFQLTIFRTELAPDPEGLGHAPDPASAWRTRQLFFGHFAVSLADEALFVHAERTSRAHPRLASASDRTLDVRLLDWSIRLDPDDPRVIVLRGSRAAGEHGDGPAASIELRCDIGRGPVFHGPGGVNTKGDEPGQASYYYSLMRMPTSGTIAVGDRTLDVEGLAWMDHEFSSNQLSDDQEGWDWFALQLDDGTDVMAYRLRRPDGTTDHAFGTTVRGDGPATEQRRFTTAEVTLTPSEHWTSPTTGGRYPLAWTLALGDPGAPERTLRVRARFPGQELTTDRSTGISYFEGMVEVLDDRGRRIGRGYMELTGYADSLADSF